MTDEIEDGSAGNAKLVRKPRNEGSNNRTKPPSSPLPEKQKMEKVISGPVSKRQRTFGDKVKNALFGDTAKTIGSYIIWDIAVPAAKNMLYEMIVGGASMRLFGEPRANDRIARDRGRSVVVPYDRFYRGNDGPRDQRHRDGRSPSASATRSRFNFDDLVLSSKADAEDALESLFDAVDKYGQVTVSDFYDVLGMGNEATFVDREFGWTDRELQPQNSYVERVREGYILVLPRPIHLDY